MPLTASSPIEPPGKRIGLTTKLSVVNASRAPPASIVATSASASSAGEAKAGTSTPSISVCVALPPAPCAIVMWASRSFGRRARCFAIMSSTRCSRSLTLESRRHRHTTSRSRAKRP